MLERVAPSGGWISEFRFRTHFATRYAHDVPVEASDTGMDWESARRTFQTALIWITVAALAFVLWHIRHGLLVMFGAIVLAVILHVLASVISDWTRMPHGAGLALATGVVAALIGLTAWRFGAQLSGQFTELMQHVEAGAQSLQSMFNNSGLAQLGAKMTEKGTSFITSSLSSALSMGLRFIEVAIVLAIGAVYLAAQPALYRAGFAKMFRPGQRPRATRALDLTGRTLKLWLPGQLVLMLMVGVLSFIAVWLIGLPNPVALALIAGVLEIVPYIGPFVSAIPAVLVALTLGLSPAIWTIIAYVVIHVFEGYVTAPMIERYFVTIPPALILSEIVVSDLLFGTIGVIMAAPITVVVYMAVKMMYVDDPLEDRSAQSS